MFFHCSIEANRFLSRAKKRLSSRSQLPRELLTLPRYQLTFAWLAATRYTWSYNPYLDVPGS